ncbi:MAG: hypothetical protein Q9187_007539 [Circinaria calcarea]
MAFDLLGLPFELRLMIWAFLCPLLLDDYGNLETLFVNFGNGSDLRKNKANGLLWFDKLGNNLSPRILCTSRMFKNELAPFIYGQQVFVLRNAPIALKWLKSIGKVNWSHIRHIHLGDIDGQKKAIPRILAGMPKLKSLDVFGGHLIRYCVKPTYEPLRLHARAAKSIISLPHLDRLHVGPLVFNVELVKNNPNLERLTVEVALTMGEQLANGFTGLPNLKHLSLLYCGFQTQYIIDLPEGFFNRLAPLETFEYAGLYWSSKQTKEFIGQHGSTLRSMTLELTLCSLTFGNPSFVKEVSEAQQKEVTEQHLPNLAELFRNLPRLYSLKVYSVEVTCAMLTIMPPSLEILDYRLHCCNIFDLDTNVKSLALQCPKLRHFRFMGYPSPTYKVSPCANSPMFHETLNFLEAKGVLVVSPSCLARGCRPQDSLEHLRTRPCECEIKDTYRIGFRVRQPILGNFDGVSPWRTFPDDENLRVCSWCERKRMESGTSED